MPRNSGSPVFNLSSTIRTLAPAIILAVTSVASAQVPSNLTGKVAYTRIVDDATLNGRFEVHLINPDGTGDETIYEHARGLSTIVPTVSWNPDGSEIAFKSSKDFKCSPWMTEVFVMRSDGSAVRRISHPPSCDVVDQLPQGSVTVKVANHQFNAPSIYGVFVEGAKEHVELNITPGFSVDVTVPNVADLGRQQIVYVKGALGVYFNPSVWADIEAGQTVTVTNTMDIAEPGPFGLEVTNIGWTGDGSEVFFQTGNGINQIISANPGPGDEAAFIFPEGTTVEDNLVMGPSSQRFLYREAFDCIYLAERGQPKSNHTCLTQTIATSMQWLPDESGFIFYTNKFGFGANEVGRFDFASSTVTPILAIQNMAGVALSPDGEFFAYADRPTENDPWSLWGSTSDGSQQWVIVADVGMNLSWSWGPEPSISNNAAPTAAFGFSTDQLTANFSDNSSDSDGNIVSWLWSFGDGSDSSTQNPSHTYAAEGTYTVGLSVTDNGGASASVSKQVTVGGGGSSGIGESVNGIRNFDPSGAPHIPIVDDVAPIDSGFVMGTNHFGDLAKGVALTLPLGAQTGVVDTVNVWFGYKSSSLQLSDYTIELFNGNASSGPTGSALSSQSFSTSSIDADEDGSNVKVTHHALSQQVTVGSSFFVVVNFGSYSALDYGGLSLASSEPVGARVEEGWEQWSDGTWHNLSDAWLSDSGAHGSGTDGWDLWIEATAGGTNTAFDPEAGEIPQQTRLLPNYPNPFADATRFGLEVAGSATVKVEMYSALGQRVATLLDETVAAGVYTLSWDATEVASGVYFARMEVEDRAQTVSVIVRR